jgi:Fe-S-cluster-containing dehydrogenase component/CRP-like cAMP-binding protein
MSTRVIKPPARLEPRNEFERVVSDAQIAGGRDITYEQLKSISIFKDVRYERVDLRALPGTIVLRRFQAGEDICLQDDPGYTAFYVLTAKEIDELKLSSLPPSTVPAEQTLAIMRAAASGAKKGKGAIDTVTMGEGELFGEMSCLYRIPRSATVRAQRDCYVLEFLRNVLDKINTGPFRNQLDDIYRKRFLELQLRNLELFRYLSPEAYAQLRDGVELRTLMPGDTIFDEHDRPDGLYIIRSGFVKIVKNTSALLGKDAITDWAALWNAIAAHSKLAPLAAQDAAPDRVKTAAENRDLLYALNDLIKKKDCATQIGFEFIGPAATWADEAKQLAAAKKEDPAKIRRFNRQLFESLFPKLIVPFGIDPPRVLAYRSSTEWVSSSSALAATGGADSALIGEIGLFEDSPRSATCVAYGQSDDRYGGVRLVYVNKQLYQNLVKTDNQATDLDQGDSISQMRVEQVARERKTQTTARLSLSVWQQESISQQFEELGLIQGQKLMLIDLDRCTRCDKCVEACVTSHSPGWFDWVPFLKNTGPKDGRSRLFLEGPRIQAFENEQIKNYLVPSTCRQCKDPVCLIGCPVGSIHKGDNGQIVIEDWCIGCSRCALNCPYNSIQMHTIGVLPRSTMGWRYRQSSGPALEGATPFRYNRDFQANYQATEPIEFSITFELTRDATSKSKMFLLQLETASSIATARINGQPIELRRLDDKEAKQKGWSHEAMLALVSAEKPAMLPGEVAPQPILRATQNEIVVQVATAGLEFGDTLFECGLTGYVPPVVDKSVAGDEYKQDWVMQTAVVCDMCSGQFGQQPACVNACPHEAAQRRSITYDTFLPVGR